MYQPPNVHLLTELVLTGIPREKKILCSGYCWTAQGRIYILEFQEITTPHVPLGPHEALSKTKTLYSSFDCLLTRVFSCLPIPFQKRPHTAPPVRAGRKSSRAAGWPDGWLHHNRARRQAIRASGASTWIRP